MLICKQSNVNAAAYIRNKAVQLILLVASEIYKGASDKFNKLYSY